MNKSNKTNAMRLMDAAKIPYRAVEYEYDESDLGGEHVAAVTGMNPDQVFKTLVARGDKKGILVFCIPVSCTLDLKKAAHAAGDKKVEMIHMKELLGLTGYIRGGCSPVGMKKKYPPLWTRRQPSMMRSPFPAAPEGFRWCWIPSSSWNMPKSRRQIWWNIDSFGRM